MEEIVRKYLEGIEPLKPYLNWQYKEVSVEDIVVALFVYLVFYLIFKIFRSIILNKLKSIVQQTSAAFDDEIVEIFESIHPAFYNFIAFYLALSSLNLNESFDKVINGLALGVVIFQAVVSFISFLELILKRVVLPSSDGHENYEQKLTTYNGIKLVARILVWVTAALLLLSNLGFDITSLAASLGIGGIAVALAVQNILGDIFSSFSIYFDKPFEIGDFIIIGTDMGTVKKIGLKTTRIQTLQGEELVISNKELTGARIQNFKKMQKRRIPFTIGVTYDTSLEKLKSIPGIIENVFTRISNADLDRVHFLEFADFSLNFEIVYYHLSGDYKEYMSTRQEINFLIKEEFEKAGIEMAFPTQTLYVSKET